VAPGAGAPASGEHPPAAPGPVPPPPPGGEHQPPPPPGAPGPGGPGVPPPPPGAPPGDRRQPLVIGLAVLIVVLLGVGGFLLLSGDDDDSATGDTTTTTERETTTTEQETTTTERTTTTALTPDSEHVSSGGLTFTRLPEPWEDWQTSGGHVSEITGAAGQFVVVQESTPWGGRWIGNVLIGDLSSQFSYSGEEDLREATHAFADSLIANYYVEDAESSIVQEREVTIDGHPGYFIHHELTFQAEGLETTREKVITVLVDTGRPRPGAFFASIPYNRADLNEGMDAAYHSLRVND